MCYKTMSYDYQKNDVTYFIEWHISAVDEARFKVKYVDENEHPRFSQGIVSFPNGVFGGDLDRYVREGVDFTINTKSFL